MKVSAPFPDHLGYQNPQIYCSRQNRSARSRQSSYLPSALDEQLSDAILASLDVPWPNRAWGNPEDDLLSLSMFERQDGGGGPGESVEGEGEHEVDLEARLVRQGRFFCGSCRFDV